MLRLARRSAPLGLAVVLVLVMQGSALAATTKAVSITNFAFTPVSVSLKLGDSVMWTNNAVGTSHTSTSDGTDICCPSGAQLWKSGTLGSLATFTETFTAAGSYGYHCTIHTFMVGTVKVKGKATPTAGGTSTVFKITWATAIPTGYKVNVQIKRPTGGFVPFLTGTITLSAMFTPDAGVGTYQFRSQIQLISDPTKLSGFSAATKITVS